MYICSSVIDVQIPLLFSVCTDCSIVQKQVFIPFDTRISFSVIVKKKRKKRRNMVRDFLGSKCYELGYGLI